jgi:hypothetical protein
MSTAQLIDQNSAYTPIREDRLTLLDSRRQQVDALMLGKPAYTQLI